MHACLLHAKQQDDPDPERPGCGASPAQGASRARGAIALRLSTRGAGADLGATHSEGIARSIGEIDTRGAETIGGGDRARRPGRAVIVLDASAAVELVLQTPTGARVAARLGRDGDTLHVPHLLDLEVASALRRLEATVAITRAEATQGLATLAALDLVRYAHDIFVPRIWQLRQNVTVC